MKNIATASLTGAAVPTTDREREMLRRRRARRSARPLPEPVSAVPGVLPVERLRAEGEAWLRDGQIRQMSAKTLTERRRLLEKLAWFLKSEAISSCDRDALGRFLVYCARPLGPGECRWDNPGSACARRRPRPVTIQSYYRILRAFFNWLVAQERLRASPLEKVAAPVARLDQIQPLTHEQLAALLEAARKSPYPLRNVAILLFLLDTGVRAAELCGLTMENLNLDERYATILGKGQKRRIVRFGPTTARRLVEYLRLDERTPMDPVFIAERGHKAGDGLTPGGLSQTIRRLGDAAGLEGARCSPHSLRHRFALDFLRNGGGEFALMHAMGHTSTATTRRYVNVASGDLDVRWRAASPVENFIKGRR